MKKDITNKYYVLPCEKKWEVKLVSYIIYNDKKVKEGNK